MIFVFFEYDVLVMLDEVIVFFEKYGDEVKILVGGYSFILMMKLWFVLLEYLIDINNILGFLYIKEEDGYLKIGVMICELELEESEIICSKYFIFMDVFKLIVDF